ncbi:MAG: hypothetical protein U0795_17350 [Pirellulales bacterium]
MRVGEQRIDLETSVRMIWPGWSGFFSPAKYYHRPTYSRRGSSQSAEVALKEGLKVSQVCVDEAEGVARVDLTVSAEADIDTDGVFWCIDLTSMMGPNGTIELIEPQDSSSPSRWPLPVAAEGEPKDAVVARGFRCTSPRGEIELVAERTLAWKLRSEPAIRLASPADPTAYFDFSEPKIVQAPKGVQMYAALLAGKLLKGQTSATQFTIRVTPRPEPEPVHLALKPNHSGRVFEGIGGNFRLQFPDTDREVISYCLENLPVRWGRIAMPWGRWHPVFEQDPIQAARAGKLDDSVRESLEMARLLADRGMPVIVSVWDPPTWATVPDPEPDTMRGVALDASRLVDISRSIASFLSYLQSEYGIEAKLFSLNEPETGVEVRQTAEEHRAFILALGRELAAQRLSTRIMLGDTANFTRRSLDFLGPAIEDRETHAYIGAVAMHTWRGNADEDLEGWVTSADKLQVPLLVTEGGVDAHAHEYPDLFREPWFQLEEADLYVRICNRAQPSSILHWQMTADYSLLSGRGIYGTEGPLRPTQRFWNMKQLGSTPAGAISLPVTSDRTNVACAAFGDRKSGMYLVHVVNRGGKSAALVNGWPREVTSLRVLTTSRDKGMEPGEAVEVVDGEAKIDLDAESFTTLIRAYEGE